MARPRIVILGAGFGGLYVASRLSASARRKEIEVTLVNRTNYFLFTPLLHEVATGGLTPTSVIEPLREILAGTGIRVIQGDVASVDAAARVVRMGGDELPYDRLAVATGATTAWYGIPGAEEHGLPLKTLADAIRIRERVIDAFEQASRIRDREARKRRLSFAVVGGGATGVELAAELVEFAGGMERRYHRGASECRGDDLSISLVSAAPELLAQFPVSLRDAAAGHLRRLGVDVRLDAQVSTVRTDGLVMRDGGFIPASVVIWTAGVMPDAPRFEGEPPFLARGRIRVGPDLAAVGDASVFALGDAAAVEAGDAQPPPMLAQVAVAQAAVVAENLLASIRGRPTRPFRYRSKGSLVSLGQWYAVGEVFSARLRGRFAWWLWRTIYLFKFLSWKKRLRIAFEWTVNLFYPRDISKLT